MSRLKASTFSQPLCGIPEDSTARRASHVGARLPRFSARLNARACRGRGRASELVVEVGSPGWARTSDPLINSQSQAHTQRHADTLAAQETRPLLVEQVA